MLFSLIEKNDFDCLRSLKDNGVVEGGKCFCILLAIRDIFSIISRKILWYLTPCGLDFVTTMLNK